VNTKTYALGKPGEFYLACGGGELDLSSEAGSFRQHIVNQRTGEVMPGDILKAGGKIKLPSATVVWLIKEN
jgi:hypothetical protein